MSNHRLVHAERAWSRVGLCALVLGLAPDVARGVEDHDPRGERGVRVTRVLSQKMPNVPGKTMTVVAVDYHPAGVSRPHRHPASGMVFAYVIEGAIRSQLENEPARVYRAGDS